MKKADIFFAGVFFLLLSVCANAQTKTGADFFVGQWNVLAIESPNGDIKMIVNLARKEGKLTGKINIQKEQTEVSEIESVDENKDSITIYFSGSGYPVSLFLKKKDDDHLTGNVMGMFDAESVRIKENK
jgi:hypothetical protein